MKKELLFLIISLLFVLIIIGMLQNEQIGTVIVKAENYICDNWIKKNE